MAIALSAQALSEIKHFDRLVHQTGESWWGHRTAGGQCRLRRRADILHSYIPFESGVRVLEIGAGAGALTEAVLRRVPSAHIMAVDISPASIEQLRKRVRAYRHVEAAVQDILHLHYDDATFDAVIGNSALHHVEVRACLAELRRVLKPGGRLAIFEPNLLNPEVLLETFAMRRLATRGLDYSESERTHTAWTYRRWLTECGFTDANVRHFDFLHPITPSPLVGIMDRIGRLLELLPLVRHLCGSLVLTGSRS